MEKVKDVVVLEGICFVIVVGEVLGCELLLFFFVDDGIVFLEFVFINLKKDIVVLLFLSGMIGLFKGVMIIYYNFVVGLFVLFLCDVFFVDLVVLILFLFYYIYVLFCMMGGCL